MDAAVFRDDLPPLARQLMLDAGFGQRGGVLTLGGVAADELVERFGSPLYVIDRGVVEARYRALAAALAPFAQVYYSVKANPQPGVAACLVSLGAGLEVASGAELRWARAAGCAAPRILFAGPGKGEAELRLALAMGIGEIHLESFEEVEMLAALAREAGRRADVALRINPMAAAQGGAMRMGGKPTAFGFDEEQMDEALASVLAHDSLRLTGLHVYAGTQILQAEVLLQQWAYGLDLASRLAARLGRPLACIDLGGGLGIPYHPGQTGLDLAAVARGAAQLARRQAEDAAIAGAKVLVEPGRWLVGPAGVYLMRVRAVKTSRGQRFVVTDGGMHHHLAASGNLGQVIKQDYPLVAATRLDAAHDGAASVVGPLCTPLDTLARQGLLPAVIRPGDTLAVLQSGAYGLTASPVGFLGHPMPAEVLVGAGRVQLMRPGGTMEQPLVNIGEPPR